eukprot:COSAG01_NODE_4883_length_4654_cov_4.488694_4_plen_157_part_00
MIARDSQAHPACLPACALGHHHQSGEAMLGALAGRGEPRLDVRVEVAISALAAVLAEVDACYHGDGCDGGGGGGGGARCSLAVGSCRSASIRVPGVKSRSKTSLTALRAPGHLQTRSALLGDIEQRLQDGWQPATAGDGHRYYVHPNGLDIFDPAA